MLSQVTSTTAQEVPSSPQGGAANSWAILILLLGFALRVFNLGAESLWYDETVSAYLASQPLVELIAHTARDIHPPAYYLLLYFWRLLAHPTVAFGLEFLYGWPSLFLSLLVMALTYAITKRAFGPAAALWALAFAAIQPTQIWSAQEVRMYALGAFALMLTLWAVSPLFVEPKSTQGPESNLSPNYILYVLASLLGLYTLYYFLFWLAILNLTIIVRLWKRKILLRNWVLLQLLVFIGWLPWLPTFIHQVVDPPVPPWRLPWQSFKDLLFAKSEALAASWVGHVAPLEITWPWALGVVAVAIAFYVYAKLIRPSTRILWLVLYFGPVTLLLLVSVIGPPIYHVRYVATYAPIFVILFGALLSSIPRYAAILVAALFTLISASSLFQLWTNPLYAADDHRSAVATIAAEWRPGDAILVNAGWVYTALAIYWPTELPNPDATRPPAISEIVRLDYPLNVSSPLSATLPVIFRTGSVDGDSKLGWSMPESDFFATSQEDTTEALAQLAATHARIWHYRLYDTVNDPSGVIRQWLGDNTELEQSQPISGRDFLRLERYRTDTTIAPLANSTSIIFTEAGIELLDSSQATTIPAGEMLYVNLLWETPSPNNMTTPPAVSLRLYDDQGRMLLQKDEAAILDPSHTVPQSLALPIPADTIPGHYNVAMLLYAPDTLTPYPAVAADGSAVDSPILLGEVMIDLPQIVPHTKAPLASFDYIDLLAVELPSSPHAPGESLATAWTWQPQSSDYRDQYVAHLELSSGNSTSISLGEFNLGGDTYLSSSWPPLFPLKQHIPLQLPENSAPGTYQLRIFITRASDAQLIPARQPWRLGQQPAITVGEVEIASDNQE